MIHRSHIIRPRETSHFLPENDSTSPSHNYKKLSTNLDHSHGAGDSLGNLVRKTTSIPHQPAVDYGFHPFKLYRVPLQVRQAMQPSTPYDYSKDWRTFRVRCGMVFNRSASDYVPGVRDCNALYQNSFVTEIDGSNRSFVSGSKIDFIVDDNAVTWFWLDYTQMWLRPTEPTAVSCPILYGVDPTTPQGGSEGGFSYLYPWTAFPDKDSLTSPNKQVLLGYVDTQTFSSKQIAIAQNFIYTNLDLSFCSSQPVRYYGFWIGSPRNYYPPNAMVKYSFMRLTKNIRATYIAKVADPDQYGGTPVTNTTGWDEISEYEVP